MSKQFSHVGTYKNNKGEIVVKLTNDPEFRTKHLAREGITITFVELPKLMTKQEAMENMNFDKPVDKPAVEVTPEMLEQALAQIPTREKGRFLSKEVRMERAKELLMA